MAYDEASVERRIRDFLLSNFLFTEEDGSLSRDASLLEEGVVDSVGVLELVLFVEETFGLKVEDEEIVPANFDSIGALTAYVVRKLGREKESQEGKTVGAGE